MFKKCERDGEKYGSTPLPQTKKLNTNRPAYMRNTHTQTRVTWCYNTSLNIETTSLFSYNASYCVVSPRWPLFQGALCVKTISNIPERSDNLLIWVTNRHLRLSRDYIRGHFVLARKFL